MGHVKLWKCTNSSCPSRRGVTDQLVARFAPLCDGGDRELMLARRAAAIRRQKPRKAMRGAIVSICFWGSVFLGDRRNGRASLLSQQVYTNGRIGMQASWLVQSLQTGG